MKLRNEVVCIGSKSFDSSQQESLGFLAVMAGRKILLDCGPYTMQQLKRVGIRASELDYIFLSHAHVDHCGGIPWLLNTLVFEEYYTTPESGRTITLIAPTMSPGTGLLAYIEEQFGWLLANGRLRILYGIDDTKGVSKLVFSTFSVSHTIENVGLSIESDGLRVVYVPDTNLENASEWARSLNNTSLVIFSVGGSAKDSALVSKYGFTTARRAADLCKEASVQVVWMFHLFENINREAAVSEAMEALGPGCLKFPQPGDVAVLR